MGYSATKDYIRADLSKAGQVFWFDALQCVQASVQIVTHTAFGGSPVLEAVVSNARGNETAQLLATVLGSGTYELDANGEILPSIDVGDLAIRYLGLRVKTAGSAGDTADIHFVGKDLNASGTVDIQSDGDLPRGL